MSSTSTSNKHLAQDLFLSLTPERVLAAVEVAGLAPRPVCYPLNSFENRVYEVELEDRRRVVIKFYRPGRWSPEQILEEHRFLAELDTAEIPVTPMLSFPGDGTLREIDGIHFAIAARKGGRAPDELTNELARRLGYLVGRMHAVGARSPAAERPRLTADHYITSRVDWLVQNQTIPESYALRYYHAALAIADEYERRVEGVAFQRIHADLHLGNILLRDGELRVLDFDDMVMGPPVQDLWLALPGRDLETDHQRAVFLEAYEQFRDFDHSTLKLIEPLRGLRMVRYAAWLARRWHDPAFKAGWPHFGTDDYWRRETEDLEEQLQVIRQEIPPPEDEGPALGDNDSAATGDEATLTNKDFFWDWEGD